MKVMAPRMVKIFHEVDSSSRQAPLLRNEFPEANRNSSRYLSFMAKLLINNGQHFKEIYPPGARPRKKHCAGFTLIELLIVITILSLLMLLLTAGFQHVRDRAKIQYCQNNLREIGMALNCYTKLWEGRLLPTTGPDDDDFRPLYPHCIDTLKVFVCMQTSNEVNTPEDLKDNAPGGRMGAPGHSYEYLGYYRFDTEGNMLKKPILKTRASADARGDIIWVAMDAMEAGIPMFPDLYDNHFEAGGNVLYADSHVEWVSIGQWEYKFKRGNSSKTVKAGSEADQ